MINYELRIPIYLDDNSRKNNSIRYDSCQVFNFNKKIKLNKTTLLQSNVTLDSYIVLVGDNGKYHIDFKNIIFESEEKMLNQIHKFMDDLVIIMSFISQLQNINYHLYQNKFYWRAEEIKIINEDEVENIKINNDLNHIEVYDRLRIKESLSTKMIMELKLEGLIDNFSIKIKNDTINYLYETYYRALGTISYVSKFFNLFSIIEFIETNYNAVVNTNKILDEESSNELIQKIKDEIKQINLEKDLENRIIGGLCQNIKRTTIETRKEKLLKILTEVMDIKYVQKGSTKIDIDHDFVSKIINIRNSLYHSKTLEKEDIDNLNKYTINLLPVCEKIINFIIEEQK